MRKIFIGVIMLGTVALAMQASTAEALVIGAYEWRMWTETTTTTGLSHNQLATIFDTANGELKPDNLSNVVGGIDFTGWNWATTGDFRLAIEEDLAPLTFTSIPTYRYELVGTDTAEWAPRLTAGFGVTRSFIGFDQSWAISRDVDAAGDIPLSVAIQDNLADGIHSGIDLIITDRVGLSEGHIDFRGVLLRRPIAPVPEPGTMILMGSGIVGLVLYRKMKPKLNT